MDKIFDNHKLYTDSELDMPPYISSALIDL